MVRWRGRVLVLDCEKRKAVAVVRGLRAAKWYVVCASDRIFAPARFSSASKRFIKLPSPSSSSFLQELVRILRHLSIDALFPLEDETILLLSRMRGRLPDSIILPIPSTEQLETAQDKYHTYIVAKSLGVPYPDSMLVRDEEMIKEVSHRIGFPLVLKPRRGSGARGVVMVRDIKEMRMRYRDLRAAYGELIAQKFIPHGGAYGFCALCRDGQILTSFTFRRIREFPVRGGPSTCRVAERIPEIEHFGKLLLSYMRWQSLAMVEFRRDANSGIVYLMEINPRVWGSISLAIAAGVNFPAMALDAAMGLSVDFQQWQEGTIRRWFWGEILHFLGKHHYLTAVKEAVRMLFNSENCDVLTWRDPIPIFATIIDSFLYAISDRKFWHNIFGRGL